MKGKTKTILAILLAVAIVAVAAVGTVTFLKDNGRAAAADEEGNRTLPVAGSDERETNPGEQETQPGNLNEGEQVAEPENTETPNATTPTTGTTGTTTTTPATTGTTTNAGRTGTGTTTPAGQPAPTTIEQERLESTTLNWSNIELNGNVGGRSVNYTKLKYTVNYIVVGAEELNETETGKADIGTTVTVPDEDIEDHCPTGYKPDEKNDPSVDIKENEEDNVINVYYVKDESQRKDITYTVKHYIEDKYQEKDDYTETVSVWVNDETAPVSYKVNEKKYTGYKLKSSDVAETAKDKDVFTVVYEKDDTQRKDITYTVKHYIEDKYQDKDDFTETVSVWVNDETAPVSYKVDEKKYTGYKLKSSDVTETAKDGDVFTVVYEKDDTQVKTMSYTVQYYKDDVEVKEDKQIVTKDVWVNATTMEVDVDDINVTNKYTGYSCTKTDPKEIPTVIEADGVIKVYYTINSYSYKVQHYYETEQDKYELDASKTDIVPSANYNTEISEFTKKEIDGYEFEKVETTNSKTEDGKLPLVISTNPDNNIIKVYYKKLSFDYSVEHYYETTPNKFEIDAEKTFTATAKFGAEISDYTTEPKTGFEFEKVEVVNSKTNDGKLPLVVSTNTENNVIKVYYIKTSYGYTIEYYYNGVKDDDATVTDTAKYGSKINEYPNKNREGFSLEKTENCPLTVTENAEDNVMKVYYGTPDISVTSIVASHAHVGDTLTYTITLTNNGRVAGTIPVTNILPDDVTYITSSDDGTEANGTVTWNSITVEPGTPKVLTITVKVNDNAIGETLLDTVEVPGKDAIVLRTDVEELKSTLQEIKQGETGKDSVNIVLVMDLSTSMKDPIMKFTECTHEHKYRTAGFIFTWTEEYCPEGCQYSNSRGKWGKTENTNQTRIQAAKAAAQGFINNIYTDPNSKATVTVVTFNKQSGNSKYVGTKVLTFGENNNKTATKDNYGDLVDEIGNITIGNNLGTHIKAALDTTYDVISGTNGLKTQYPNNSNVVIFLGDGEPSDSYSNNTPEDIEARARDIDSATGAAATTYSIGFGEDATDPTGKGYPVLQSISSDNTVLTANDYSELSQIFTNIQAQLKDKTEGTHVGTLTFTASNTLVVDSSNPIKAKVGETEIFTCTDITKLEDYSITYDPETKVLTWDLNEWNSDPNHIHVTSDNAVLSYYVER